MAVMRGRCRYGWLVVLLGSLCAAQTAFVHAENADEDSAPRNERSESPAPDDREQPNGPALDDAPKLERQVLQRLLTASAWPKRAIAAVRLERYDCDETRDMLVNLTRDHVWQVRAFALRSLGRRSATNESISLDNEDHARVVRTALRLGFSFDPDKLQHGIETLAKSDNYDDRVLAAELAAASGVEPLRDRAREILKKVILRMSRAEAGALSKRLARLTGHTRAHTHIQWRHWMLKQSANFQLNSAVVRTPPRPRRQLPEIATMSSEAFAGLEQYIKKLQQRELDLAIVMDCTNSMYYELADAQSGIDDLLFFVGDLVGSLRIGLVAYRDRQEEFETKAWDFSRNPQAVRQNLWSLTTAGGGDKPEAVYKALKVAYTKFNWDPNRTMRLILVGDAPPHIGFGTQCVEYARQAGQAGLVTHVVQAISEDEEKEEDVKHFPEIAEAGNGRCVRLGRTGSLTAEIAGLTLGDQYDEAFREFFKIYLWLCR